MQHGTGREYLTDLLENVLAVVDNGRNKDVVKALNDALNVLTIGVIPLDVPGLFGPDYPS